MPSRNVELEFDALKTDFGKLSAHIAALTQALGTLAGEDAQEVLAKFQGVLGHAKEEAGVAATALEKQGCKAIDSITHQMRERPLTSILIGLGLGLVAGKLLSR
jgi:ElaB/YqjD/DUF883 family membrane-anchored ribosome-binding protein